MSNYGHDSRRFETCTGCGKYICPECQRETKKRWYVEPYRNDLTGHDGGGYWNEEWCVICPDCEKRLTEGDKN